MAKKFRLDFNRRGWSTMFTNNSGTISLCRQGIRRFFDVPYHSQSITFVISAKPFDEAQKVELDFMRGFRVWDYNNESWRYSAISSSAYRMIRAYLRGKVNKNNPFYVGIEY